jgi:hypothetical protein
MEWDNKTKLVQLGNGINDISSRRKFNDYVLEQLPNFDPQAWDMFVTVVNLVREEMEEDIEFWKLMHPKIEAMINNSKGFSFRAAIRFEMINLICNDILKTHKL